MRKKGNGRIKWCEICVAVKGKSKLWRQRRGGAILSLSPGEDGTRGGDARAEAGRQSVQAGKQRKGKCERF